MSIEIEGVEYVGKWNRQIEISFLGMCMNGWILLKKKL